MRFFGVGPVRSSQSEGNGICIFCLKTKAGAQPTPWEVWAGTILVVVGRMEVNVGVSICELRHVRNRSATLLLLQSKYGTCYYQYIHRHCSQGDVAVSPVTLLYQCHIPAWPTQELLNTSNLITHPAPGFTIAAAWYVAVHQSRINHIAIDIAYNCRGPGTTQHYRSPKYRVVCSTLNPMLSGIPTSALGVRSGKKNITQEPQLQASDMKRLPLLMAGSACCVNKLASRGQAASVLAASSSGSGFSGGGRLQDPAWAVAEMAHSSVHFGLPSHLAFLWDGRRSQSRSALSEIKMQSAEKIQQQHEQTRSHSLSLLALDCSLDLKMYFRISAIERVMERGRESAWADLSDSRSTQELVIHCTSIQTAAHSLGKSGGNITGLECRPTYLDLHENILDHASIPARHTSSKPLMLAGLGVHNVADPLVRSEVLLFTDLLVPVSDRLQKGHGSS
ncbi:unnamed protein product [Leuciscus chuanchicus]